MLNSMDKTKKKPFPKQVEKTSFLSYEHSGQEKNAADQNDIYSIYHPDSYGAL